MGGNVKIGEHRAHPIPTKNRRQDLCYEIYTMLCDFSVELEHYANLKIRFFDTWYSGSTAHLMNPLISDEDFCLVKPTIGDIDVLFPAEHKDTLIKYLEMSDYFGDHVILGTQKHGEEISCLLKNSYQFRKPFQLDFVFVKNPHDPGEQFCHSSSWKDTRLGIKGVHHKLLLNALGLDEYKFSITHGLRSRNETDMFQTKNPSSILSKLFSYNTHSAFASANAVYSFIDLIYLLQHEDVEVQKAVSAKFIDSVSKLKNVDSKLALKYLEELIYV